MKIIINEKVKDYLNKKNSRILCLNLMKSGGG